MDKRLVGAVAAFAALAAAVAGAALQGTSASALPVPQPSLTDWKLISAGATPPSEAQCESVGRTCFTPQAIQSAYNLGPLYADHKDGKGITIAIVDSYGSDTMAHDLRVFDDAFNLPHMCGEEGISCAPGMPTFKVFNPNGSPATKPQPGKGTHQEDKSAWALEVALDVETSHAIAPGANILLVATNNAETLGVQGFPNMMKAEKYVVDNHMAQVITQSFGSAEDAFGSPAAIENLRDAFKAAAANHVTVLASSGDDGSAGQKKTPVKAGGTYFTYPVVGWPASDPLVTAVGGTYLCTDPTADTNDARTIYTQADGQVAGRCLANPTEGEVGWTFSGGGFSHVFSKPAYQNTLPAGSTAIGSMRGVPDIAFQASAGTGALVYLSLPPDGLSGVGCPPDGAPCSTGWYDIGGTSLSAPQWAGLVAIAAQINGGGLGPINAGLYKLANSNNYASDFFDVTTGNNTDSADPPTPVPGYPATTGWDPVTGLGTPNAANLLPALVTAVNGP